MGGRQRTTLFMDVEKSEKASKESGGRERKPKKRSP